MAIVLRCYKEHINNDFLLKNRTNANSNRVLSGASLGYDIYCGAVNLIEEKLKERGAAIVQESLKIEYGPSASEKEACLQFGRQFIERCTEVS